MAQKKFALPSDALRPLVPHSGGCLATDRIMVDGCKVGYMYRERTVRPTDTGWRFFSGDESPDYINNLDNSGVYAVNTVANYDPDIIPYLDTPAPSAFERIAGTNTYRRTEE